MKRKEEAQTEREEDRDRVKRDGSRVRGGEDRGQLTRGVRWSRNEERGWGPERVSCDRERGETEAEAGRQGDDAAGRRRRKVEAGMEAGREAEGRVSEVEASEGASERWRWREMEMETRKGRDGPCK